VGKGLPTLQALTGLLSSMDTEVANKVSSVTKGFPAFFAIKRVFLQCGLFYAK
jgi:hypothetical protein